MPAEGAATASSRRVYSYMTLAPFAPLACVIYALASAGKGVVDLFAKWIVFK